MSLAAADPLFTCAFFVRVITHSPGQISRLCLIWKRATAQPTAKTVCLFYNMGVGITASAQMFERSLQKCMIGRPYGRKKL